MAKPIKVLIIEDSEDDALLMVRELERGGFEPAWRRIQTAAELEQALDEEQWEIILSDYRMPGFTGAEALAIVRGRGLDTPFIVVSGTAGEETAVEMMRDGADDYFLKRTLRLLPGAVARELREAEVRRARREAEERLRLLTRALEASANAVVLANRDGDIQWVNPAFTYLTGYEAEEAVGENPRILKSGRHPESFYTEMWDTILVGRVWHGELVNKRKDGTLYTQEMTITPVTDETGEVTHFIAVKQDISERKRMQERLQESEERFRSLYENATIGIYRGTPDGRTLLANPALVNMLGFDSFEELAKRNLHEEGFEPEYGRSTFVERVEREGEVRGLESAWHKRDGTVVWVRESARAIRDSSGRTLYYEGTVEDVTERMRAELELQQTLKDLSASESRLKSIVDAEPECVKVLDRKGRLVEMNPAGLAMIEADSLDQVRGKPMRSLIAPEHRPAFDSMVESVIAGGTARLEFQIVGLKGGRRWLDTHAVPLRDAKGAVTGLLGVTRDVTEQRRLTREVARQRDMFDFLLTKLPLGVVLLDSEDRYAYVSPKSLEIDGYGGDAGGLIGQSVLVNHPRETHRAVKRLLESFRAGEASFFTREARRGARWVEIQYHALRGPLDEYQGLLRLVADITARKSSDDQLRESEERYRDLVEKAGVAIVVDDTEGRITYCNRRLGELLGYPEDELRGRTIETLLHPDDRERVVEMHRAHLSSDSAPWSYQFRGVHRDGRTLHLAVDVTPLVANGQVAGTRSYIRDVTEEQLLQEQLVQAQKMESVGRLAGGVAHDFNNILQAILMHADVALEAAGDGDDEGGHLREIRAAADRASALTRQLLAFSRREEMNPRRLELNSLIEGELKMLRRVISEDIEIEFRPAGQELWVEGDPGQLEQVVMNLVVNARDAMPRGGRLTIATGAVAGDEGQPQVHLTIADNGHGMDEATRQRIFEPFFTTKERERGTGLGLATVYGIVTRHGGDIRVESEPGEGATFTVALPAAPAHGTGGAAEKLAGGAATGGTETLLVAEDDPAVRDVVVGILEGAGYTVLVAGDGEEAVEIFSERSEDVAMVILDAIMPRKDGIEALAEIRALRPEVPALFSSGYSGTALGSTRGLAEDVRLIEKPYTVSQLLTAIRTVLDGTSPGAARR